MTVDEAKTMLGQRFDSGLAKRIKAKRQTVSKWRSDGKVPELYADRIRLYATQDQPTDAGNSSQAETQG